MATSLNSGYTNNVNTIQIRTNGTGMQRVTDRAIDFDGDGSVEAVSITYVSGDASGSGGKMRNTVTVPDGAPRTVVQRIAETDGGLNKDTDVNEFTEGVE